MNISEIRQKYPQYEHVNDQQLADALHEKYYSHVPKDVFYSKIGLSQEPQKPEEPQQSFLNKLPRNLLAGATRGLAGLANIPYDIASMSGGLQRQDPYEQRLMQSLGEQQQQLSAERIPHFGEHDYSKMFGITGEPTAADQAIQLGTEFALPIGGSLKYGYKGLRAGLKAASELPLTRKMAAKPLVRAEKAIGERNITNIPISNDLIKESKKIFKDDPYYKHLLEQAKQGDYRAQFTLQSDLGKKAHDLSRSSSGAERFSAERVKRLKDQVLEGMKKHLEAMGQEDIAKDLTKGRKGYRQFHQINKKVYKPAIKTAKYVGIPTTLGALLTAAYKHSQD